MACIETLLHPHNVASYKEGFTAARCFYFHCSVLFEVTQDLKVKLWLCSSFVSLAKLLCSKKLLRQYFVWNKSLRSDVWKECRWNVTSVHHHHGLKYSWPYISTVLCVTQDWKAKLVPLLLLFTWGFGCEGGIFLSWTCCYLPLWTN